MARAGVEVPLDASLPDGAWGEYALQLAAPAVARWDRAVVVVLLDSRPDPDSNRPESLQRAIAVEGLPPTATLPSTTTAPPTAAATAGPSPTPTATPAWLEPPRFGSLAGRTQGGR